MSAPDKKFRSKRAPEPRKKKDARPDFIKYASDNLRGFADALWNEHDALVERKAPVLDVLAVAMDTAECEIKQRTVEGIIAEEGTDTLGQLLCAEVNGMDSMSQEQFFRELTYKLLPDARAALIKALQ